LDGFYGRRRDLLHRPIYQISVEIDMSELDVIIHQPVRLRVMSALVALEPGEQMDFVYLRNLLKVTDGNLGAHLVKLEEAGYIEIEKTFVARKPRTFISVTGKGRDAFAGHIAALRQIIKDTQKQ
jgi:DNA-binding MarR family transcriptional regulator